MFRNLLSSQCRQIAHKDAAFYQIRRLATPAADRYKVLVVGGGSTILFPSNESLTVILFFRITGTGGLSVAQQIYDRFKAAGKPLGDGEIAIVDGATDHYYQVSTAFIVSMP
jgi:sulfide:quinone oxidoreductase